MSNQYTATLETIEQVAKIFCDQIKDKKLFLLYGEMGAGKTNFIKAICKQLKVKQEVTSPTFTIVNEYNSMQFKTIYHFDLYRIENIKELDEIGFIEYINSDALVFIEWAEKLNNYLPDDYHAIKIEIIDNNTRLIEF